MKGSSNVPPAFRDDQLEINTNSLTQALVLVAQVQTAGRYRGEVLNPDGTMRWFSLSVVPAPGEPSVVIDVAGRGRIDYLFRRGEWLSRRNGR